MTAVIMTTRTAEGKGGGIGTEASIGCVIGLGNKMTGRGTIGGEGGGVEALVGREALEGVLSGWRLGFWAVKVFSR